MITNDFTPPNIDRTESNTHSHMASKQPYVVPILENLGDYELTIGQVASLPVNP
jgi:hypothetical protein